jgi:hypothetical protein
MLHIFQQMQVTLSDKKSSSREHASGLGRTVLQLLNGG